MEQTLQKLLTSDSKIIQEGSKELKNAFKNPEAIPALCDVLVSSSNPQIRQTVAVVLRRKLGKKTQWNKLSPDLRNKIKQGMMQALVNEQEKLVKNSIAQFIGILGKHEFPSNSWPEILHFIHTLCSSDNLLDKELGMYTLSIMTEMSKGSYIVHAEMLGNLFTNMLTNVPDLNTNLAFYTIITMKNLVSALAGHQQMVNIYHSLLPRVLEVINAFAPNDESRACDLLEILEELIDHVVAVILPHVRSVVEMCLRISSSKENETSVQIKAVSIIGWLIRSKSKVIQKNKLVEPIIDVLLQLMAQQPEDDVNEEYFLGDPDQFTATTVAAQTLDLMALNVPPEKVVPYLLTKVEPALQASDIYAQKAGYLALAVLAEGCADYIRTKYLESFLKCIYNGIRSPNVVVRNAAFFALGQFSEHLQPEISNYASELLPVFFEFISRLYAEMEQNKSEPNGLDRMFYALETFCINLDEALLPYLPTLMERILYALDPQSPLQSFQLKRVALRTLDAVICAVENNMLPYFQKIIELLYLYINSNTDETEIHELQSHAIECLASVAEHIEAEHFKPLALQALQMGMGILEKTDDPDVKKSVYALFAALSGVMKQEINPALPKIVQFMLDSIQNTDGIIAVCDEEDEDALDIYDDLSDTDEEEDIEQESTCSESSQARYSVENSYNDEKEQACISLGDISKNIGVAFMPYLAKSFEEIFKLINYPQEDIKSAAIDAVQQFCVTLAEVKTPEGKQDLHKALQMFVPKCAELISFDEEQNIVTLCTNAFGNLLESVKGDVLIGDGHKEAIMNCIISLLTQRTVCQDTDMGAGEGGAEDEAESETTELLLECAGDVIPKFGNALTPDEFVQYFPNILHLLTIRTKKNNSVSQRSFAYGTLAECMKPLGLHIEKFLMPLLQLWHSGAKDFNEDCRNNAIYGLGEMILHGKDVVFTHYNDILQLLSQMLAKESHAGTMDNICGAVAKMIITNPNGVPLEQVFPVLLQHLPLKSDFQENEAVLKCLYGLYQQGNPILRQNLDTVIKVAVHIYHNKQTEKDEVSNLLNEFLQTVNTNFPQEFGSVVSSMGPEVTESVKKLFN